MTDAKGLRAVDAVMAALFALAADVASAQAYPTRPIRLIVPFGPGGGSDFVGRLIAQKLTEQTGQQVVVDNRTGAASLVGTEIAQRAAPDGYTLLLGDTGFSINVAYYKNAKYDPVKDFEPVTVVADTPYILAVDPGLPYAGSLKDLIAAASAKRSPLLPDVATFGESGVPDVLVSNGYGVLSGGGTPQPVVKKLHAEISRAIATPEMRERLAASGLDPAPVTPEQFRKNIAAEVERWKRVVKESGIRQE